MFRLMKSIFKENLITVLPEDGFHGPKQLGGKLRNNIQIRMNLVSTVTLQLTNSTEYVQSYNISSAVFRWFYYVYFVHEAYSVTMTSLISRDNFKKLVIFSYFFQFFSTYLSKYDVAKIFSGQHIVCRSFCVLLNDAVKCLS